MSLMTRFIETRCRNEGFKVYLLNLHDNMDVIENYWAKTTSTATFQKFISFKLELSVIYDFFCSVRKDEELKNMIGFFYLLFKLNEQNITNSLPIPKDNIEIIQARQNVIDTISILQKHFDYNECKTKVPEIWDKYDEMMKDNKFFQSIK